MSGSPWVTAYQSVADGDGVLLPGRRAIKFGPGFVTTDVPAEVLSTSTGSGQVVGYSLVTFEHGGYPVDYLEDGTEAPDVAGSGWLRGGAGPRDLLVGLATSGAADRSLVSWDDGDLGLGDGAGTTTISGRTGIFCTVFDATIFAMGLEQSLADAPSIYIGTDGEPCGIVIPEGVKQVEFTRLDRPDAGNAYDLNITGQSATDGDGGDITLTAGLKGGAGTTNGAIVLTTGGLECARTDDGLIQLGNPANNSTASIRLVTATQTTVGAAGGASVLPGAPAGYARINVDGTERLMPYWAIP